MAPVLLPSAGIRGMMYPVLLLGYWRVRDHPQAGGPHTSGLFWLRGRVVSRTLAVLSLIIPFSGLPSIACSVWGCVEPQAPVSFRITATNTRSPWSGRWPQPSARPTANIGSGSCAVVLGAVDQRGVASCEPEPCTGNREFADSGTDSTVPLFPAWVQWQTLVWGLVGGGCVVGRHRRDACAGPHRRARTRGPGRRVSPAGFGAGPGSRRGGSLRLATASDRDGGRRRGGGYRGNRVGSLWPGACGGRVWHR